MTVLYGGTDLRDVGDTERCDRGHGGQLASAANWGSAEWGWRGPGGPGNRAWAAVRGEKGPVLAALLGAGCSPWHKGIPPSPGMCLLSDQRCCHSHFAGQRPSPWFGLTLGCWEPPEPEQLPLHPRTSGEPPRGTAPCREMHQGHPEASPALLQAPWASHPRICQGDNCPPGITLRTSTGCRVVLFVLKKAILI